MEFNFFSILCFFSIIIVCGVGLFFIRILFKIESDNIKNQKLFNKFVR